MNEKCNCTNYKDLETRAALNKRGHETKKILAGFKLIAEEVTGEHKLYQCPKCGQFWQRSLDWMRGNNAYSFKVPEMNVEAWRKQPFVQPDELFNQVGRIQQYLEQARFEERNEKCRHEGCGELAIRLSVLCALHHMENIGIKKPLPDNCTWFGPYQKRDFELSMNYLKGLPNYIHLRKES